MDEPVRRNALRLLRPTGLFFLERLRLAAQVGRSFRGGTPAGL